MILSTRRVLSRRRWLLLVALLCVLVGAIAGLHAEWAKLETPGRMQELATRYLSLRPVEATQYDQLKNLPPRPPNFIRPDDPDPIGAMIETIDATATGSRPAPEDQQ